MSPTMAAVSDSNPLDQTRAEEPLRPARKLKFGLRYGCRE